MELGWQLASRHLYILLWKWES